MGTLYGFLKENVEVVENEKFVLSNKFKDENGKELQFEIRPLTEKEVSNIRKACTKRIKTKSGVQEEIDSVLMANKMIVESVVFPPFKSEELQKSYSVIGAEELVQTMLTSGEYAKLISKIEEICGYDEDMEDLIEEAKN